MKRLPPFTYGLLATALNFIFNAFELATSDMTGEKRRAAKMTPEQVADRAINEGTALLSDLVYVFIIVFIGCIIYNTIFKNYIHEN